jgi:hypothetical protein
MQRLKPYINAFVWQAGLGYLLLWTVTYWTLDQGAVVFGGSGACYPDAAKVLFYWTCDRGSALALVAMLANFALTVTVWAPVYVAAATVNPDAIVIAAPIISAHVMGLPTAIFVLLRFTLRGVEMMRRAVRWASAGARARPLKKVQSGILSD